VIATEKLRRNPSLRCASMKIFDWLRHRRSRSPEMPAKKIDSHR